jgi:hypothetical protein
MMLWMAPPLAPRCHGRTAVEGRCASTAAREPPANGRPLSFSRGEAGSIRNPCRRHEAWPVLRCPLESTVVPLMDARFRARMLSALERGAERLPEPRDYRDDDREREPVT